MSFVQTDLSGFRSTALWIEVFLSIEGVVMVMVMVNFAV
jgi:hypothetical protein